MVSINRLNTGSLTLGGDYAPYEYKTITLVNASEAKTILRVKGYPIGTICPAKDISDTGLESTFIGWFMDEDGTEQVTSDMIVNSDMTLYAIWDRKLYWHKSNLLGDIGQTIENNVISNMSEDRINITNFAINFEKQFDIVVAATVGEFTSSEQDVVGSLGSNYNTEFGIFKKEFWWEAGKWLSSEKKCTYDPINDAYPTDEGYDENCAITMKYGLSGIAPEVNKKYWWKYASEYDEESGNHYIRGYISTDGATWIKDMEVNCTIEHVAKLVFGTEYDEPIQYWRGSIDLGNSYVKINEYTYTFNYVDTRSAIVSFNGNGGTPDRDSVEIEANTSLYKLPSADAANEYTFLGWFTDELGGTEITTDTIFSEDTTIYAHWVADEGETEEIKPLTPDSQLIYNDSRVVIGYNTITDANLADRYALGVSDSVFTNCLDIGSVSLRNVKTTGITSFQNCTNITTVNLQKVQKIGQQAFEGCTSLTSVYAPETTTIGSAAFRNCTNLAAIDVSKATTIESKAFSSCQALKSFMISDGNTTVQDEVFRYCYGLANVSIPASVKSIGEYAFASCNALASIGTELVSEQTEDANQVPSMLLHEGLTTIGTGAFRACKILATIVLPNSVTSIKSGAFYKCSTLSTVSIPGISSSSIVSGTTDWFDGCTQEITVTLADATYKVVGTTWEKK